MLALCNHKRYAASPRVTLVSAAHGLIERDGQAPSAASLAAAAEAFGAPLVTVDDRLLRACHDAGIPAVHLDRITARG